MKLTDEVLKLITIIIYMMVMLGIGWYAYRRTDDLSDYILGGRSLGPAVTALSAGASDMSGWLLMGLPGAIYLNGLTSVWIAIGLTLGAYLNWIFVAPRLRAYTEASNDSLTLPSFFENRLKDDTKILRVVSAIVILTFFIFYISSGLVAGAIFFETSFGFSYMQGLFVIGLVVVSYTLFGGFLAVSWTDFVQGIIMMTALLLVPVIAIKSTGGPSATIDTIKAIDPALLTMFNDISIIGIISLLAWGFGYVGQPHIIVRFMAINSVKETKAARRIGMSWMVLSIFGAVLTALIGIAYFNNTGLPLTDPEAVFIELGQILFHPLFAGFVLAAILAAIMSTISSQLIVTSSALTEDLYKLIFRRSAGDKELVLFGRGAVLLVAIVAFRISLNPDSSILDLVAHAWAGFGASFGPIVVLSLYWRKLTNWGAIFGMATGALTVLIWPMFKTPIYEIIPGFILNLLVAIIVSKLTYKYNQKIEDEFDESLRILKE